MINYIKLGLRPLSDKFDEDSPFQLEMTIQNLEMFVFSNILFNGQEAGLPAEVSRRVFDLIIFKGNWHGEESLSKWVFYMIKFTADKAIKMGKDERFRYIGQGKFIEDCLVDERLFNELADFLR